MKYWLLKSEPSTYSWHDLQKLGQDKWDGVRNYQARNHLKAMKKGDKAFFYHSMKEKSIVGVVSIIQEYYPDPTYPHTSPEWVVVDVQPLTTLQKAVSLEMIKQEPSLADMVLIKNSRLSVQPVTEAAYEKIIEMSMLCH